MINTTTEPTAPRYPILVCMTRLSRSTFLYAGTRKRAYQKADGGPYADAATSHGHPWMLLHRQGLLDLLYRRLPEKETRVLTNKKVVSIETQADGVRVRCDDGSTEEGSIVTGCDGVHSRGRQIMRDLSLRSSAKVRDSESPMVAQYQVLDGHQNQNQHQTKGRQRKHRDTRIKNQQHKKTETQTKKQKQTPTKTKTNPTTTKKKKNEISGWFGIGSACFM